MKQDYRIYFLTSVSFEALKLTMPIDGKKELLPEKWNNLGLFLDESKKNVEIRPIDDDNMTIGYLSEEDGQEYIPYLKKGWEKNQLFECFVVNINKQSLDASQRIQVAIRIKQQ